MACSCSRAAPAPCALCTTTWRALREVGIGNERSPRSAMRPARHRGRTRVSVRIAEGPSRPLRMRARPRMTTLVVVKNVYAEDGGEIRTWDGSAEELDAAGAQGGGSASHRAPGPGA